ncbi:hypothetical protein [Lewinella sp. W8]|uniref:hypothetical protein n=1 Tax=Lewinella sp. W8 TaxID=2528208 RepID=UPI0010684CE0|nr:hypothetical protein [Lewinella sp. W8]MTB53959.1 hypothetical protein [Lewinella sp. W8]
MKYILPALAALLLFVSGCQESLEELGRVDDTRFRAEYALPLLDSRVTLDELIGDVDDNVSVSIDPDGLLRFRYSGTVPEVGAGMFFDRLNELVAGLFVPVTSNRQAIPFSGNEQFGPDELHVKGGLLTYSLPNSYDEPVNVEVSIPEATLDGVPLTITGSIPAYEGTGPRPALTNPEDPVDLAGYIMRLPQDSLFVEYRLTDAEGNELETVDGSAIVITGLNFDYVEGFIGQEVYPGGRDTIFVDFFENYLGGEVFFVNPTITMTLENSFGLPAKALVDVLSIIDVNGNELPIEGPAIDDGFDFDFPTVPGDIATTTFVFDTSNSNIDEILSSQPVAVDYEVNALINPDNDTELDGFLSDTAFYRARVDVELPLYGNADNFTIRDTFPINIMDDYESITEVTFRLTTENSLPLDVEITGVFLDSLGNVLAALSAEELNLIRGSAVDANGNPLEVVETTNDLVFGGERLEAIREAASLAIVLDFSTSEGGTPFVRVTNDQALRVLLGAIVTVDRL